MDRTRQMFEIDEDVSDEEEVPSPSGKLGKSPSLQSSYAINTASLYEENLEKYVNYLNEFAKSAEDAEVKTFIDGATYVNRPLIDITQIVPWS
jgi:hypothetical protein